MRLLLWFLSGVFYLPLSFNIICLEVVEQFCLFLHLWLLSGFVIVEALVWSGGFYSGICGAWCSLNFIVRWFGVWPYFWDILICYCVGYCFYSFLGFLVSLHARCTFVLTPLFLDWGRLTFFLLILKVCIVISSHSERLSSSTSSLLMILSKATCILLQCLYLQHFFTILY